MLIPVGKLRPDEWFLLYYHVMENQTDDQIIEFMIIKAIKTLSRPQRL